MKNLMLLAAVAALVALSPTCVESAFAGEIYLGTITSTDAGSVNNGTTATPFYINPSSLLTVQCDGGANVITDQSTVTAVTGVRLGADYLFSTSSNGPHNLTLRDGGVQANAGIVAVKPITGVSTVGCTVWTVKGNE
jgi:hypothetical protein